MVSPAPPPVITIHIKELWMAEGLGGVKEGDIDPIFIDPPEPQWLRLA